MVLEWFCRGVGIGTCKKNLKKCWMVFLVLVLFSDRGGGGGGGWF